MRHSTPRFDSATRVAPGTAATVPSASTFTTAHSGFVPQRNAKPRGASTSNVEASSGVNGAASASSRRQLSRRAIFGSRQSLVTGTGDFNRACSGMSKKYSPTKTTGSPSARSFSNTRASFVLSRS